MLDLGRHMEGIVVLCAGFQEKSARNIRLGEAASSLPRKADKRGNTCGNSRRPEVQLFTGIKDWYHVKTLKFSPYSEDALKI
jgi:hypothetical protein